MTNEQKDSRHEQHRFRFKGEITLGHIIQFIGMVGMGIGLYVNMTVRINTVEVTQRYQGDQIVYLQRQSEKISDNQSALINLTRKIAQ